MDYATLIEVLETYEHPEAWEGAQAQLRALARLVGDPTMDQFKIELAAAVRDPESVPAGALDNAAEYDDGAADLYLTRLWGELYPDEPLPEVR